MCVVAPLGAEEDYSEKDLRRREHCFSYGCADVNLERRETAECRVKIITSPIAAIAGLVGVLIGPHCRPAG